MFPRLRLSRPLAVFDVESTGLNPRSDRIIELSIVKVFPDWSKKEVYTWRFNPCMPIPPESTAVHGITDADVAACPHFSDEVDNIDAILADCDLGGYNLIHFDIPILEEEFMRCGRPFDLDSRKVIDAQKIYFRKEPRDLTAAVRFFCGREHDGAHGAEADAIATLDVIKGEFARYADLPDNLDAIDREYNERDESSVDRAGKFKWENGEVIVNFGKKKGATLKDLQQNDKGFLKWMVKSDFPLDTRKIAEDALEGIFPKPHGAK